MSLAKEEIKQIAESIIKEETGIFDCVYQEFLEDFLQRVNSLLSTEILSEVKFDIPCCLHRIGEVIREDLIEICQRMLIGEIYLSGDSLVGNDETQKYEMFCQQYMQERYEKDFAETTTIYKLIHTKLDYRFGALEEFVNRIVHDIDLIKTTFSIDSHEISKIVIGEGDTHNGGRSVFCVEFDNGKRIVYKPHTLINDELFGGFLNRLSKYKEIKYPLHMPRVMNRGTYGWQEFITTEECVSETAVQQYMYRFGSLVAIAYLINSTDLHFENIIAHMDELYVIDLETLFFNRTIFGKDMTEVEDGIAKLLRHSVFNSALLPTNLKADMKKNLDFSGLMGGYGEMIYHTLVVVNRNQADIHFEECDVDVKDGMKAGNIVRLFGKDINVMDYIDYVVNGFEDCYKCFLNNRDDLRAFFSGDYWMHGKYRQVLRHTQLYWKFLQASYHPNYIKETDKRKYVFSKLYNEEQHSLERVRLGKYEEEQLMQLDIPYFYTGYDVNDLYVDESKKIENFYAKSIKQIVLDNIDKLSLNDMKKQIYFIKSSYMKQMNSDSQQSLVKVNLPDEIQNDDYLITKLVDALLETYLITEEKQMHNNMLTMYENECNGYSLDVMHFGMYYGGGVVNLLLHMYSEKKEPRYLNIAMGLLRTYNNNLSKMEELDIGVFSGIGSLLWMNYNAYKYTKDDSFKQNYLSVIYYLMTRNDEVAGYDIMSGCAGLIILCSRIYEDTSDKRLLSVIKKYLDKLVRNLDLKNLLTGFAHGLSGISAALIIAGKYFGKEFYSLGMDCIYEENRFYDEEYMNWKDKRNIEAPPKAYWCYGATGILTARLMIRGYLEEEDKQYVQKDIENAVQCIMNQEFTGDNLTHTLCHGILGNMDVMLTYLQEYPDDKKVADLVERHYRTIIKTICNDGYVSELPMEMAIPDFMIGQAGVPYLLLRYKDRNMKSILQMEV